MAQPIIEQQIGFITRGVLKLFTLMKWLSMSELLSLKFKIFRSRSKLNQVEILDPNFVKKRGRAFDFYILSWWFVETILVLISCMIDNPPVFVVVFSYLLIFIRVIEIIQVSGNTFIFDSLRGRKDRIMASSTRTIILAAFNFIELMLCFGVIYSYNLPFLQGAGRPETAYYFSILTQLTTNADIYPIGWLRIIAVIQSMVSFTFIVLVFSFLISSIPSIKFYTDMPLPQKKPTKNKEHPS